MAERARERARSARICSLCVLCVLCELCVFRLVREAARRRSLHFLRSPYGLHQMNVVDMVVVGLLIVNTILGAVRGFALQAFKLASIVLAIWLAHRFSGEFAE